MSAKKKNEDIQAIKSNTEATNRLNGNIELLIKKLEIMSGKSMISSTIKGMFSNPKKE